MYWTKLCARGLSTRAALVPFQKAMGENSRLRLTLGSTTPGALLEVGMGRRRRCVWRPWWCWLPGFTAPLGGPENSRVLLHLLLNNQKKRMGSRSSGYQQHHQEITTVDSAGMKFPWYKHGHRRMAQMKFKYSVALALSLRTSKFQNKWLRN